jgi:hypothetical protein
MNSKNTGAVKMVTDLLKHEWASREVGKSVLINPVIFAAKNNLSAEVVTGALQDIARPGAPHTWITRVAKGVYEIVSEPMSAREASGNTSHHSRISALEAEVADLRDILKRAGLI